MGRIISRSRFNLLEDCRYLVVMVDGSCEEATSINKLLAEELLKLKPEQRTLQLENCFGRVLSKLQIDCVIKDLDVMFNPEYEIDILRILVEQNKRHPIRVIWPGGYNDGWLIYGEEGYSDYKKYKVSDYDILCVTKGETTNEVF